MAAHITTSIRGGSATRGPLSWPTARRAAPCRGISTHPLPGSTFDGYNLIAASEGTVERGTDTYSVTVHELTGRERDRVYDEQARRYPGFADYARQTAGARTIPVLALRRS
jgi:hypothetical protein